MGFVKQNWRLAMADRNWTEHKAANRTWCGSSNAISPVDTLKRSLPCTRHSKKGPHTLTGLAVITHQPKWLGYARLAQLNSHKRDESATCSPVIGLGLGHSENPITQLWQKRQNVHQQPAYQFLTWSHKEIHSVWCQDVDNTTEQTRECLHTILYFVIASQ